MSQPKIFAGPLSKSEIQRLADEEFGNMVKFVVDLERKVICAGGGLHSDEEQMLLDDGSTQSNLWGANFYLSRPKMDRLEYTSMINIRPSEGNKKQEITLTKIREQVKTLADLFFKEFD